MKNSDNPAEPVTLQPADKQPVSDTTMHLKSYSHCWRTIFCCKKAPPKDEARAVEINQVGIVTPRQYPLVQSAFPANMAGDIENGCDEMPSEMSEDPDIEDFIRGYPQIRLDSTS